MFKFEEFVVCYIFLAWDEVLVGGLWNQRQHRRRIEVKQKQSETSTSIFPLYQLVGEKSGLSTDSQNSIFFSKNGQTNFRWSVMHKTHCLEPFDTSIVGILTFNPSVSTNCVNNISRRDLIELYSFFIAVQFESGFRRLDPKGNMYVCHRSACQGVTSTVNYSVNVIRWNVWKISWGFMCTQNYFLFWWITRSALIYAWNFVWSFLVEP